VSAAEPPTSSAADDRTPPTVEIIAPAPPGTRLGRYVLGERLGVGGMAEVYRARASGALGFELPVAIKWLRRGIGERPEAVAMFVTEARISTRLRHPNIVAVSDFDRDDGGRLYLVMELVDGLDLAALAATGPLPAPVLIHVATGLARGLGFAHELPDVGPPPDPIAGGRRDGAEPPRWDGVRGVIHRDVSPQNTLLSWQGAVKVSDFGIARVRAATLASATLQVSGKPAYMSPEQARGQPLDGRSDLFAIGVMMWELATGRRLFGGGSPREVLARLLFAPIADPRLLRPELADDLAGLTMRLLSRPVSGRPRGAGELVAALTGCRDAPTDGEAALADLLATRFPGACPRRAPVRALQEAVTLTRRSTRPWYDRSMPATSATPMVTLEAWRAAGEIMRWRDHDVFVRTAGDGAPLLLIHGFPTASWDWWPLWAPLAARFRLVTCDMLGFGFSARPRGHAYRIVDQAELLLAVLARAGVSRCRVLAHDYGVTVAQELLARRRDGTLPVRLDGVALLNGGLFPEAHRPLLTQKLLASPLGPLLVRLTGRRRFAASMRAIWGARPIDPAELDAMWALVSRDGGLRALPALLDYMRQRRAHRDRWVGALTDPALATGPDRLPIRLIDGLADPISGAHLVARYRALVPSPDVVELAGVGHYPQLEAPDAVLAAVLAGFGD